jgi:DNA-binding GntR family transcriptional regulator
LGRTGEASGDEALRRSGLPGSVPAIADDRWQQLAQARAVFEPTMLRLSIERGDLEWEARVRAAHHRLTRTPPYEQDGGVYYSDEWAAVHRGFHRTLLDACGNEVLLETFDRCGSKPYRR